MSEKLRVTAAFVAVENGMGQQIADSALIAALNQRPTLHLQPYPIGSLRAKSTLQRRLPLGPLDRSPYVIKRLAGVLAYPRTLVHRFDCRLPPAPSEVVTVHDLAPLRYPDEGRWPRHVGQGLRRARAVICPSQFSADEVSNEYGLSNVFVVPNGVDVALLEARPLTSTHRRQLGIPARYVLHTGGATVRKNLASLAAAWPAVRSSVPDVELVMCGPEDPRRRELFEHLPGVHLIGKVPRPTLIGLMASAAVVVVPSRYEGFGLPALEAMACGAPVVAARSASLPEVLQGFGRLVDPGAEGLADGIVTTLAGVDGSTIAAARAAAAERTWEASATRYVDIYRAVSSDGAL